ncbi:MAG: TetR/AcrR family transcriptional regulator [Cryomorphaceae bacterium]|nr:MAG: TetR/AcrR family transcriptional regulator [Cryomorphaceae bacterium]
MPNQLSHVRIAVHPKVYVKDPLSSELGEQILTTSLLMIDELGLEQFTFRKLAARIGTTESAVYRYFENKHKLLLYYMSWYWGWLEYQLAFGTVNINDAAERLKRAINIITAPSRISINQVFDEDLLMRVVVAESPKAYLTKQVDDENKEGFFVGLKQVAGRISEMISEVAPGYPYPRTLSSTLLQSHLDQRFFHAHLPSLSDAKAHPGNMFEFYTDMIFNTIKPWSR